MPRLVVPPPDRASVLAAQEFLPLPRARRGWGAARLVARRGAPAGAAHFCSRHSGEVAHGVAQPAATAGAANFQRRRRQGAALLGLRLLALLVLVTLPLPGWGQGLPATEPTPVAELGPPQGRGAAVQIAAAGATLRVHPSRRSAQVIARWRLRAAPGPLQLLVPSTLRPLTFSVANNDSDGAEASGRELEPGLDGAGGVAIVDVVPSDEVRPPIPELRIDPGSAAVYEVGAPPDRPPAGLVAYLLTVEVPGSGELVLRASATLSSGLDRRHWRRTNFEQAHALHKRRDPLVYQFAVRGPAGPLTVIAERGTAARARIIDGVLRAAAAAPRPSVVGLTLGIGPAVASLAPDPPGSAGSAPLLVQGLLRASLDVLLPHRDALAFSVEAGSDLRDGHHVGGALVYELYTPAWPYLPIGGHLDLGVSCDLWQSRGVGLGLQGAPSLRCGGRLGILANVGYVGIAPSVDVFPPLSEMAPGSTETRFTAQYRVAILVTVGL